MNMTACYEILAIFAFLASLILAVCVGVGKLAADFLKKAERERQGYFREHGNLINKKFQTGLTKKENLRLKIVRWQIDRIEDALIGENLDKWDTIVDNLEYFADFLRGPK
jgi:hypothetical protein